METAFVVTCTKAKTLTPPEGLIFSTITPGTVGEVVTRWQAQARQVLEQQSAHQLYCGTGWAHVQRAYKKTASELFVISAGFGLLKGDETIPSYAATFSPEADRVADALTGYNSATEAHQAWWRSINEARCGMALPMCERFSSFERVVVALSAHYFAAIRDDLEALAQERGPESLFVLATGIRPFAVPDALRACLLPIGIQVESLLNGPRTTLNQRALVWLMEEIVPTAGWERASLEAEILRRLIEIPRVEVQTKPRQSDQDVTAWVHEQWQIEPKLGRTALLRRLRAAGRACEQKRFGRLIDTIEREDGGA